MATAPKKPGSAMTQSCCPHCRLRFTPALSAYLVACPECGERPQPIIGLEQTVGFRLVAPEDTPDELPQAVAVSLPVLDSGPRP